MTEKEAAVWHEMQVLMQRFQRAERIVLGTPMWNFAPPYKPKQLIDLVAQRRYLFSYDGKQYGPHAEGRKSREVLHSNARSVNTSAFIVTYVVKLPRSLLLPESFSECRRIDLILAPVRAHGNGLCENTGIEERSGAR